MRIEGCIIVGFCFSTKCGDWSMLVHEIFTKEPHLNNMCKNVYPGSIWLFYHQPAPLKALRSFHLDKGVLLF